LSPGRGATGTGREAGAGDGRTQADHLLPLGGGQRRAGRQVAAGEFPEPGELGGQHTAGAAEQDQRLRSGLGQVAPGPDVIRERISRRPLAPGRSVL
jgi:hypothetical protein